MKSIIDLLILLLVSVGVIWISPALGVFVLLINVIFATQYWKTLLLIGLEPDSGTTARKVKAGVLAAVFTAILFVILNDQPPAPRVAMIHDLWNADFFPMVLSIAFLSSLLMAALITEKRKR